MQTHHSEIAIRALEPQDKPFVFATWLKSYRHGSEFARRITDKIYYYFHKSIVTRILDRTTTRTIIAHPKGETDVIVGYLVYELHQPGLVHFIYVKKAFRDLGIAKALFAATGFELDATSFTHWCKDTDWVAEKYPALTYNPYLI